MEKISPQSTVPGPQSRLIHRIQLDCEPKTVKELAESMRVSMRFIYQMRARGFPMHGRERHNQTATVREARDWIRASNFRLIKGIGVIGN
jgi:hypothetical protein